MAIKIIKNKDGKFETITIPDPNPKTLENLHKEVREMIEGNKQFHDDPYSKENQDKNNNDSGVSEETTLPFDPDLWIQNNIFP